MEENNEVKCNCNVFERFFKDKTELHLLSLGQGGGLYEMTDGIQFSVKVCEDNRVLIKSFDGEYNKTSEHDGLQALVEFLQREMYIDVLKIKRKYGSFTFYGDLLYAPQDYYDDDDTVTLIATKYHRIRMGFQGSVVLRKFEMDKDVSEMDIEDVQKALQVYFNIFSHIGFRCYLNDDTIPTKENDICVKIPAELTTDDMASFMNKVAENDKSFINDKIKVDDCVVRGYTYFINDKPFQIINEKWEKLRQKHNKKYHEASILHGKYSQEKNITKDDIEKWIDVCLDFLNDNEIPKGVRMEKYNSLYDKLGKLCWKHGILLGDYLKLVNKLLTTDKN